MQSMFERVVFLKEFSVSENQSALVHRQLFVRDRDPATAQMSPSTTVSIGEEEIVALALTTTAMLAFSFPHSSDGTCVHFKLNLALDLERTVNDYDFIVRSTDKQHKQSRMGALPQKWLKNREEGRRAENTQFGKDAIIATTSRK